MEDPVPNVPAMVSRLPKFGLRPTAVAGPAPLTNGTQHQPVSSTTGKGLPTATTRQNRTIRMPPSSLKGKKGKGGEPVERGVDSVEEDRTGAGHHPRQPQHSPTVVREIKKPSTMTATVKVQGCASNCPRTIRSRTGFRGAIPKQASSGQSLGNGQAGGWRSGTASLRRGQSRDSPHSSLSHSQSNDSLEMATEENMVRSQSLTHVKRIPSPTEPPIIRSYSFNRASELTKELPRPLAKSSLVKTSPLASPTPVLSSRGRGNDLRLSKGGPRLAPGRAGVGTTNCTLPPITLRKSLLPSSASSTTKPLALSYRLTRPSLIKQPRPVLVATSQKVHGNTEESEGRRNSVEMPTVTPDPTNITDSPGSTPEGLLEEPVAPSGVHPLGEGLEDMSLSSSSSLERNDTSEEYMDDFDNLGNGGDGILLLPAQNGGLDQSQPDLDDDDNADVNQRHGGTSMNGLHSFLSDSVDWARMGLTGGGGGLGVLSLRASHALSGGADYPLGSSLDLSPSDSGSGGTYMWDEEGLEPLGTITHPCGSYDSDLNSMDILNNLDNLESGCDLDDDDLMLDDDLPEDGTLHSDSDGMSHLAHWKRQLCWTAEDHLHNDNRSDLGFQPYDGYQGTGLAGLHQVVELDELTLKHMAEDCYSVKTQLEYLNLLLQVEGGCEKDDTLTLDTLSPESREDPIQARQVEELLKEVQELREELRSKDRTIAQLTQHVAVPVEATRCHCQQHRDVERVTVTYHDKATQTPPWRGHAPQILQPSRPCPNSMQQTQPQGRLTSSAHTEAPSEPSSSNPGCGDSTKRIPDPRLPQSPGSLKTVSIPKRPQEGPTTTQMSMARFPRVVRGIQGRSGPRPGFTAPQSRLRQLPPPFRGLPCYTSTPQASASFLGAALLACPQTKAPRQTPGLREPEIGGLKARGLVPPSLLRLPKPKSH